MNFRWRSRKQQSYSSVEWHDSEAMRGVRFAVRRVSLGQRIELMRQARELSIQSEFLRAGEAADAFEAAMGDLLLRRLYLRWGLAAVEGLDIDGEAADVNALVEKGPEPLVDEIADKLKLQLGLSDDERKNC